MDEVRANLNRYMRKLCTEIGSRHCGSPALDEAGEYVAEQFSALGLPVRKEPFPVPGWRFRAFSFLDLTTGEAVPAASACYYSGAADITDVPLWLEISDPEETELPDVRGRLCFVASWYAKSTTRYYNRVAALLEQKGAAAAVFLSVGQTDLSPNTKIERNPFVKSMASVSVAQAGALYIANHREDTYHLVVDAESFDATAFNVIARLGSGPRRAVIGAHYDAAPLIQGAADNAGGTAVLLELARLLRGRVPDEWTVELAAFSAEEIVPDQLPLGSEDYVKRHGQEPIEWLLNIDGPSAYFDVPVVLLGLPEKLPPIRYPYETQPTSYIGDDKAFGKVGIPSVWIFKRRAFGERHTPEDNLSCIDFSRMEKTVHEYVDLFTQLVHSAGGKNG